MTGGDRPPLQVLTGIPREPAGSAYESPGSTRLQLTVSFDYALEFTRTVFDPTNPTLVDAIRRLEPRRRHRLLCFVDQGVLVARPDLPAALADYVNAHAGSLELLETALPVAGGEPGKTARAVESMQQQMLEAGLDRHSVVLAVGGGAALDAIGFAAATFHRGIRLVRLPTTVLAQNDGGVGVKNGVNAAGIKNLLGSFSPPFAVVNDSDFLQGLPQRDLRGGMAEAVKVAAIRDRSFFDWIERHAADLTSGSRAAVEYLIRRCAQLHLAQISAGGDPFEQGSARPLDYGHWSAHKLEVLSGYRLRHGEAVAIGMALDAFYAANIGLLEPADAERLATLLEQLGFTLYHEALDVEEDGGSALLTGLEEFRQHLGGQLCITLLPAIGQGLEVSQMLDAQILRAREQLRSRVSGPTLP